MPERDAYLLHPVGVIRSRLRSRREAPKQGFEGAPDAWLEVFSAFMEGLQGIARGDEIVVITWLHLALRDTLKVHPRGDPGNPLTGVFSTRSPDRPNPIGLHRVTVVDIDTSRGIKVRPLEALDGTPVIDIKPVMTRIRDE